MLGLIVLFWKSKLPRIKEILMIKNVKEHTHWVSLFIDRNTAVCFDSFGIEYNPQEVLNKIKNKSVTHNILRNEDNKSVTCRFYCIAIIKYVLAGKSLLD